MSLVKARCTNCGEEIMTNTAKDAAICPFCGDAYVVEKAIRLYRQPVEAPSKENGVNGKEPLGNGVVSEEPDVDDGEEMSDLVEGSPESNLAQKVFQAIEASQTHAVRGYFKCAREDAPGVFETEEILHQELRKQLDEALLAPRPAGNGLDSILKIYGEKYSSYDTVREEMEDDRVSGGIKALLKKGGIPFEEVSVRRLTLNQCEYKEWKELFGLMTRREKKLVTKEIKAIFVSCGQQGRE